MNATQLANKIILGINDGTFPAASLKITANQLCTAWPVTRAVAIEATMILCDNFKIVG